MIFARFSFIFSRAISPALPSSLRYDATGAIRAAVFCAVGLVGSVFVRHEVPRLRAFGPSLGMTGLGVFFYVCVVIAGAVE